jgi:hypothetical protein
MALSVISRPAGVVVKFNTITKIYKYKGFQEGHHFLSMAMEVHGAPGVIWIISLRNVLVFSTIND